MYNKGELSNLKTQTDFLTKVSHEVRTPLNAIVGFAATLDEVERTLTAEDIVITDGEKPVCIAGVMGCTESGVSDTTKNIVLEVLKKFDDVRKSLDIF